MEKKEAKKKSMMKMMGGGGSTFSNDQFLPTSSSSSNYSLQTGFFDMSMNDVEKNSFGFMELMGIQDFNPSLQDFTQQQQQPYLASETSDVTNLPATPSSDLISSSSNEAANDHDEQVKLLDDVMKDEQVAKSKQESKPKRRTNQKKQREQRFAFMTRSEVDHLEDGYRWRKYGQKAVKNSPYPRSYYRCTTGTCGVKKRIERSSDDPSVVVTTYEGQHTHFSPVMMPRGSGGGSTIGFSPSSASVDAGRFALSSSMQMYQYQQLMQLQQQQQPYFHTSLSYTSTSATSLSPSHTSFHEGSFSNATSQASLLRDHGLLQDIVPPDMRNDEQN